MTFDKTFEDKQSEKSKDRPQLEAMLQYVRDGDHIYVHSMDRLARNLKNLLDIVNQVTDKGCSIHFVSQSLEFSKNDSSPTAKLMLQILGSIYEFELQLIHERQREGIEIAKKHGKYKTGRPLKMTDDKIKMCIEKQALGIKISKIAKELGVSHDDNLQKSKKKDESVVFMSNVTKVKTIIFDKNKCVFYSPRFIELRQKTTFYQTYL